MKPKDASFLELHAEKIALGVGAFILLLVAYYFVIGRPWSVPIGSTLTEPNEVLVLMEKDAKRLQSSLNNPDADFPPPEVKGIAAQIRSKMRQSASQRLAGGFAPAMQVWSTANIEDAGPAKPYPLPRIPAVAEQQGRAGFAVLSFDQDPLVESELLELIGNPPGRDFRYVSVMGTFDLAQWRSRLEESGIPRGWWEEKLLVTSVTLERQEVDPKTGQPLGPTQVVAIAPLPQPLQVALGADTNFETFPEAEAAYSLLVRSQPLVQTPLFPNTTPETAWEPPNVEQQKLTPEQVAQISSLDIATRQLQEELNDLRRRLGPRLQNGSGIGGAVGPLGGVNRPRPLPPRRTDEAELDDRGSSGSPTGGPGSSGGPSPIEQRMIERVATLEAQIAANRVQMQAIRAGTAVDPNMLEQEDPDGGGRRQPGFTGLDGVVGGRPFPRGRGGIDNGGGLGAGDNPDGTVSGTGPNGGVARLDVWAHDLTPQSGKAYRYRLLVSMMNPLLMQNELVTEQQAIRTRLALGLDAEREDTPWTDPISLEPAVRYFLVGGEATREGDNSLGRTEPKATVELWTVFNGRWHSGEVTLRPGDPIAGTILVDGQGVLVQAPAAVVDVLNRGTGFGREDIQVLLVDQASGQMTTRRVADDLRSPQRSELIAGQTNEVASGIVE